MNEEWRFLFRIIGALLLFLWLLMILRKMYYNTTRESSFLLGFIIFALTGKLLTLWLDVQIFTAWNNSFSTVFNNLIFVLPTVFYFNQGTEDKKQSTLIEYSELDRRAQTALKISDARLH